MTQLNRKYQTFSLTKQRVVRIDIKDHAGLYIGLIATCASYNSTTHVVFDAQIHYLQKCFYTTRDIYDDADNTCLFTA